MFLCKLAQLLLYNVVKIQFCRIHSNSFYNCIALTATVAVKADAATVGSWLSK